MLREVLFAGILLAACPQDPRHPDLKYEPELGLSLQKPAGQEEWAFKDKGGKVQNARVIVQHLKEDLSVEIVVQLPTSDSYDPKRVAEEEYTLRLAEGKYKEVRKKKLEDTFLPGRGAGGTRTWHVELLLRDKEDRFTEWKLWCFVGRENRCLYRVHVVGAEGTCEKHQKDVDRILGSIRIWKLAKK